MGKTTLHNCECDLCGDKFFHDYEVETAQTVNGIVVKGPNAVVRPGGCESEDLLDHRMRNADEPWTYTWWGWWLCPKCRDRITIDPRVTLDGREMSMEEFLLGKKPEESGKISSKNFVLE
jgi:hypothetical protein